MSEDVAEATESIPKEAGLVGLDSLLGQVDSTKMLAESFEPEEREGHNAKESIPDHSSDSHSHLWRLTVQRFPCGLE